MTNTTSYDGYDSMAEELDDVDSGADEDGYVEYSGGCVGDRYKEFRFHLLAKGFTKVGAGCSRSTYIRKNVVVKVPRNVDGEMDNWMEDKAWHKYKSGKTDWELLLTPCRLLSNGCLMMRTIDIQASIEKVGPKPDWSMSIDGGQVGFYKGRWLAYDYALDIKERLDWAREWNSHVSPNQEINE